MSQNWVRAVCNLIIGDSGKQVISFYLTKLSQNRGILGTSVADIWFLYHGLLIMRVNYVIGNWVAQSQMLKTFTFPSPLSAEIRHLIPCNQHVMSKMRCFPSSLSSISLFLFLYFPPFSSSHSLKSCLIWKLASFGKLAIRTILREYVYVSLVFLPINSGSRGSG